MLILRKRVLKLGYVHIWVVPPSYVVDLLILRNRVFRLRNVEILFAVMEGVRSAVIHEFSFQAAKSSDMDCAELQAGLFAD